MCKAVNNYQTSTWNTRVSRFLIIAALTVLCVQKAQSMPSRELPSSVTDDFDESTLYAQEPPPIDISVAKDRIRRDESSQRNERRDHGTLTTARTSLNDGPIRFPGEVGGHVVYPVPEPNPACAGKTFCEETASEYPQEFLSNIISRIDSLKQFSSSDKIEFSDRIDPSDGDMLCGSRSQVVYPKIAQNKNDEWVWVLQDDKQGYKQGVRVENCNEGTAEGTCQVIEGFVTGYTTSCKQKYVFRVMAAVDKNGTANADTVRMPSSCCCQIKFVGGNVGSRIAGRVTPIKSKTSAPSTTTLNP